MLLGDYVTESKRSQNTSVLCFLSFLFMGTSILKNRGLGSSSLPNLNSEMHDEKVDIYFCNIL